MTKAALLDDVMKLSPEDRLELAERLFASVEDQPGTEEMWTDEIGGRIAAIDAGEVKLLSWDEARQRIME